MASSQSGAHFPLILIFRSKAISGWAMRETTPAAAM